MAKSKETKVYRTLATNYKNTRWMVEFYEKSINDELLKLGRAKNHHDCIGKVNEEIENWYNAYVSMINTNVGLMKANQRKEEEEMKKCAKALKEDYDEDLERLYSEYLESKK